MNYLENNVFFLQFLKFTKIGNYKIYKNWKLRNLQKLKFFIFVMPIFYYSGFYITIGFLSEI